MGHRITLQEKQIDIRTPTTPFLVQACTWLKMGWFFMDALRWPIFAKITLRKNLL